MDGLARFDPKVKDPFAVPAGSQQIQGALAVE